MTAINGNLSALTGLLNKENFNKKFNKENFIKNLIKKIL